MAKMINIPFRDDMKHAILSGTKTCTSRNKLYGQNGDYFYVGDKKFVLVATSNIPLGDVATHYYRQEGFSNPGEFIGIWNQIHPRKRFQPEQGVWLHEFKEADHDQNR